MTDDMRREAFEQAMRKQADLAYQFAALMAGRPNTYQKQAAIRNMREQEDKL